jgi:NAD+ synthase
VPVLNLQALIDDRVEAIRAYHRASGIGRAQLDLSGGVDSAVMAGLLARALGPENVVTVHSAIHSDPAALSRAQEVATAFGLRLCVIELTALYEALVADMLTSFEQAYGPGEVVDAARARVGADPTVLGSIRSTLRAPVGRGFNRLFGGGIRHGTGNEDEDRVLRFYQKGGDGEVDSNPIVMLSKGEVFQLARALGVPRSVLEARPSPDLWGVGELHNDEDEIGAYLGLVGCGQSFYSYVDATTGAYRTVGLIERLSRFCDTREGDGLFDAEVDLPAIVRAATVSPAFAGVPAEVVRTLLTRARAVEAQTRHKWNPNCPALGQRALLVGAGVLTNHLPAC